MKKEIFIIASMMLLLKTASAQFPGYSKFFTLDNSTNPAPCSIDALLPDANNQYIYFALNTHKPDPGLNESVFIKADIDGNIQYQLPEVIADKSVTYKSIAKSPDGQYIYWFGTVKTTSGTNVIAQLKLVKTNLALNKIWEKLYPLNGNGGEAISVKNLAGESLMVLYSDMPTNMMQLDSAGSVLNFYSVPTDNSNLTSFVKTDQDGIITTTAKSVTGYDNIITQQWNTTFPTPPAAKIFRASLRSSDLNETYYAAGMNAKTDFSNPNWDISGFSGGITKYDKDGNHIWSKTLPIGCIQITDVLPGPDFDTYIGYQSMANTPSGGVVLAGGGSTDPILWENYKALITNADNNGNTLWHYLYSIPGIKSMALNHIVSLPDGSFIGSGFADSSSRKGLLLRVNNMGCYNAACTGMESVDSCMPLSLNTLKKDFNLNIYPNPVINQANIEFGQALGDDSWLEIRDIMGKTIIDPIPLGQKRQYALDLSGFTNGRYFIRIKTGDQLFYSKIVVLH